MWRKYPPSIPAIRETEMRRQIFIVQQYFGTPIRLHVKYDNSSSINGFYKNKVSECYVSFYLQLAKLLFNSIVYSRVDKSIFQFNGNLYSDIYKKSILSLLDVSSIDVSASVIHSLKQKSCLSIIYYDGLTMICAFESR